MVLGFAPKEHTTTLIENGAFGEDSAMPVSEVAAQYENEVDVETTRLAIKVVSRTVVEPTDDGYRAYVASEVATSLAERLTEDTGTVFGPSFTEYALTLIQMGAFGEDDAVSLSEVAASVDENDTQAVRAAVESIDSTTVTETDDGYEAHIAAEVAPTLAGRLYNDTARIL